MSTAPRPADAPASRTAPARLRRALIGVVAGLVAVEALNTVVIWSIPTLDRSRFPINYVSQGVWTLGKFVAPLDAQSPDIAPALVATRKVLHCDPGLYDDFRLDGSAFIYPPTATIELLPLGWIADRWDIPTATQWMDLTGRLAVLASIGIVAWLLRALLVNPNERVPESTLNRKQWLLAIALLAAFFPLRAAMFLVQAQSWVTLFLVGAIAAYASRYARLCGVLIGLAGCMKPQFALLVVFALVRREWRVAAAAVVTAGALIAASLALTGRDPWREYFTNVVPSTALGYAYKPNQSLNGLVHRWLGHPLFPANAAQGPELGPKSPLVSAVNLASLLVFTALTLLPRARTAPADGSRASPDSALVRGLDVSIAALAATLASPIVWEHHLAWTIVLFAFCAVAAQRMGLSHTLLFSLGLAYVLLGSYVVPVMAATSGPASLLNSPQVFGALLLLGAAWMTLRTVALRARRLVQNTTMEAPV